MDICAHTQLARSFHERCFRLFRLRQRAAGANDSPYDDNSAGDNGRNPKWKLTLLIEECPPDLVLL